jgi:tRNA dimethylallyltransferase
MGGATATGKSKLALELAQRLEIGIISADSRQVYREFDIGTAKPTLNEQKLVPHALIDICDPTETLTLADYQAQAQFKIQEAASVKNQLDPKSAKNPSVSLLVGGTGLYIKSIVKGLKIPRVAPNLNLRSQLQNLGQAYCYQLLRQIDPQGVSKIHPNDEVRTLRALEVFYTTGKPISEQQGENPPTYPILQLGLTCDPDTLTQRITQRTGEMIERGLVAEVNHLGQKYGWDLPLLDTLGYGEIKQYLQEEITLSEAKQLIILHTRQFAKRQRTWFRADPTIEWFSGDSPKVVERVWQRIEEFIS